ncbi:hypothetical protein SAMN05518672_103414 [Chitinophaga sp. CF118]|uniref:universal stress protein n=1 Tax=Chitinophaga sp. CF118 TaxID=1884367 RepID=UPI0008F04F8C|nr:universal stress protein [Chitinophaga sp. CF118]SFD83249.1 hypothetical protein SAMN05518672_103414 [Chitinophaga sp. CF118]
MKKVLLSFDGNHYSEGAFEFARKMNELEPILLKGVFLPPADFMPAWSYAFSGSSMYMQPVEDRDPALIKDTINKFESQCLENGIEFQIHKDHSSYALLGLQKESRFADMMILGGQKFYENLGQGKPNEYLRDALHETECPVVVMPENTPFPESIVLAYDGGQSSVYAIKSFISLFPHLCDNKTILLYAQHKPGEGIPDEHLIRELTTNHFSDISFYELGANPKEYLTSWLNDIDKPMLVSGAYSRSGFSQLFHRSFVTDVIKNHNVPVLIAHF